MREKGAAMSQLAYISIDWTEEAAAWRRATVRNAFRKFVVAKLKVADVGYYASCDSMDELMEMLNIEHVTDSGVFVRGDLRCSRSGIERAAHSDHPAFMMSIRSFKRLIRQIDGFRLERASSYDVDRNGKARFVLIVTNLNN